MTWDDHPPILGIDTNSHGFDVVSSVPVLMPGAEDALDGPLTYGWLKSTSKDHQERAIMMYRLAQLFFGSLPAGTSIFCEEPIFLRTNIDTTRKLNMAAAALYFAFVQARPDATWHWVDISTWRKHVLGKGGGTSAEMKQMAADHVRRGWNLQKDWPLDTEASYDNHRDLYDAHCLMDYGKLMISSGLVKVK